MNTENILKFICEEVTRQGHDINVFGDGFIRVVGMLNAWQYVEERAHSFATPDPELYDLRECAGHIEECNKALMPSYVNEHAWEGKFRTCNVTIGGRLCPHWQDVPRLMEELWKIKDEDHLTPDEVYVRFQKIHPFEDGNGRVGKILHNWLMGTLDDPVLVKDYFGGGNP